jgi:hypothetical protein
MEHLPDQVKSDIYYYAPSDELFNKHLLRLKDFTIYPNKSIYKITKVAILAYRINNSPYAKCLVFGLKRKLSRLTSRLAPHIS